MANTQSEADRLFAIIDTNKNGRIEDSELLTYLLAQGQEEDVRIARYPPPAARCAPRGFPALAAARPYEPYRAERARRAMAEHQRPLQVSRP